MEKPAEIKKVDGKIILVDDEKYEKDLLKVALRKKNWDVEVEYYNNPLEALEDLRKDKGGIFLIISDMNMPKMSGLDFKKTIDNDEVLKLKSIPFIFNTTLATKEQITEAYEYRVQGYFRKTMSVDEQAEILDIIIKYWIISLHPNQPVLEKKDVAGKAMLKDEKDKSDIVDKARK